MRSTVRTLAVMLGLAVVGLGCGGCGPLEEIEDSGVEADAGITDGGPTDAGVNDAGPADAGSDFTVELTTPAQDVRTRGALDIAVTVTGDPTQVRLLVDDVVLTDPTAPYLYTWATAAVNEGPHELKARAIRGGVTKDTPVRMVIVIRTAPQLYFGFPSGGDTNVALATPMTATFSEPMLASTVTSANVQVKRSGGLDVAHTVTLDAAGEALSISVTETPPLPETLSITASTTMTDLAGNALVDPGAWTFTAPYWYRVGGPIQKVSGRTVTATRRSLAITSAGVPYVAFTEWSGTDNSIWVVRWEDPAWVPVGGALDLVATANAVKASIGIGPSATPVVSWTELVAGVQHIAVKQWNGTAWAQLGGPLNRSATAHADGAYLVTDASGTPFVSFFEMGPLGRDIYATRWDGTSWVALGGVLDVDSTQTAWDPTMTLDAAGNPVTTWYETVLATGFNDNFVKRWTGTAWSQVGGGVKPSTTQNTIYPSVAVDGLDRPVVA